MSRSNTGSVNNYMSNAAAAVSTTPCTFACWVNPVASNARYVLMLVADSNAANYFELATSTAAKITATANVTTSGTATSVGTYSAGAWTHACAVFVSATSRIAYINGGSSGTNATNRAPSGLSLTDIAQFRSSGGGFNSLNGSIAEVAIWSDALDANEAAALGAGVSPLLIRPTSLVEYWPIIGQYSPEIGLKGAFPMTITGSMPAAVHPRIYYPDASPTNAFSQPAGFGLAYHIGSSVLSPYSLPLAQAIISGKYD